MIPEPGRRFGPYEILDQLGVGGMGFIYRAWDGRLHREVALKLLHNEFAMPGMRERFLREARAASALNHPNICTIFDIGEQNGEPYLVMELLEGITLRERISQGLLPIDDILRIARDVAEGLGAAHTRGVVHRDVKPANIFLVKKPNGDLQAKMLDFGLAKIEDAAESRARHSLDITSAGATVGTLAYMSPEQARGETLDARSDLFSLGVVMYEMATRHVPFPGATSALVFVKLLGEAPEPLRSFNESLPRELEKTILKLLAKERSGRFQNAHELELALRQIAEQGSGGWLQRAVAGIPLVRPGDSAVRPRKKLEVAPKGWTPEITTSAPSRSEESPVLRPAVRGPETSAASPLSPVKPGPELARPELVQSSPPTRTNPRLPVPPARPADSLLQGGSNSAVPDRRILGISPRVFAQVLVVVIVFAITVALALQSMHFGRALLTADDAIVLTEIENRTGNRIFDGTLAAALGMTLRQSTYLNLLPDDSYRTSRRLALAAIETTVPGSAASGDSSSGQTLARSAALRLHAKAYLYGAIENTAAGYSVHVALIDTDSDRVLAALSEPAAGEGAIPAALENLAVTLRARAGEDRRSIARNEQPLAIEATTSFAAWAAFVRGKEALAAGPSGAGDVEAMLHFQQSVSADPHFVQAKLQLVDVYGRLHAEVAAADTARLALEDAAKCSETTRDSAEYAYAMNTSGDYGRAAATMRDLVRRHPHDSAAFRKLATALRLEGRPGEALQAAEAAISGDSLDGEAYAEAEYAQWSLHRAGAAYGLAAKAASLGVSTPETMLLSRYLEGPLKAGIERTTNHLNPGRATYGLILDDSGRLSDGAALWVRAADSANKLPGLDSAASFFLAQAALDRALLTDCPASLDFARRAASIPRGLAATFNLGLAEALCGETASASEALETLRTQYPSSFVAAAFAEANLTAAIALAQNDPQAALNDLAPVSRFDGISYTLYLRARAHSALKQPHAAVADYQEILVDRGAMFMAGAGLYPAASLGLARALADVGDNNASVDAYRRFLALWVGADPGEPLLIEARAHAH